jgi:hypothetical protein
VTSHSVQAAILGIAFVIFGLVALAIVWSGDWAYAALASATANTNVTFVPTPDTPDACAQEMQMSLTRLLEVHRTWAAYVIGSASSPHGPACSLWTTTEYRHMADVRNVFVGAETFAALALGVAGFRVFRARRRGDSLRLLRDGALVATGLVAIFGLAAAVAFEPMFLLFHRVFFPQGNFLFPPESNLIRLYPEWYWQGITAGIGGSFIAIALVAAAAAHIALRRAATTYTRAG